MCIFSHNEPPIQHQSNITDSSYHRTDFGVYENYGTHNQGTINIQTPSGVSNPHNRSEALERLREHSSRTATFDSAERFDPPRCAEATRTKIIQRIEQWVTHDGSDTMPASLFWLYGGAGVGKSALAQTLAERHHNPKMLAATFFFFRNDALRNDGDNLIPSVVWQLVCSFNELRPLVERKINEDPDIITKRHESQIEGLLVEPFLNLSRLKSKDTPTSCPRLIVIDGLDECRNPEIQRSLLEAIASAIPRIPYPLRFLITSRPERHITCLFDNNPALQAITFDRYNLSEDRDASTDIREFLEKGFKEIRGSHSIGRYLTDWPDEQSVDLLVERSSGHFIYAATAIRYIRSVQHRPDERLKVILRLHPHGCQDQPYTQLDALYSLIFQSIEGQDNLEKLCLVLGILYVRDYSDLTRWSPYSNCSTIERILGMKAGDAIMLISPILSLVAIKDEDIRILHKSLIDYLLHPTRCGNVPLPFDLARVHESAATHILQEKIMADNCTISEFANFSYHCRNGYLNKPLREYLQKLEVPYPECVKTTLKDALLGANRLNPFATVAHFFRALGRDDFDPTGEFHKEYAAKWMDYLEPTVLKTCHRQGLSNLVTAVDSVKYNLDTMLREWEPTKFKPTDGPISDRHERFIEQEHRVWSALTRYRCSTSTAKSDVVSSLVFGSHFIYSYHLVIERHPTTGDNRHNASFLFLTIYTRHGNACVNFDPQVSTSGNIDKVIDDTLKLGEKFLLSDSYRKYGILPEGL